jgi:hypothetical protein
MDGKLLQNKIGDFGTGTASRLEAKFGRVPCTVKSVNILISGANDSLPEPPELDCLWLGQSTIRDGAENEWPTNGAAILLTFCEIVYEADLMITAFLSAIIVWLLWETVIGFPLSRNSRCRNKSLRWKEEGDA